VERQDDIATGEDCTSQDTNVSKEILKVQEGKRLTPTSACVHQRLIDDVLTKRGKRTGRVRCVECSVEFPDPYQGQK
jgi:hypothetical protein